MTIKRRSPGQILLLVIAIIISLTIVVNGASRLLTTSSPVAALKINPLNNDARIIHLSTALAGKVAPDELSALKSMAKTGIGLEPIDARLLSLLGIIKGLEGDSSAAQDLYQHALKLQPVELQALVHRFGFNLTSGKYAKAVSQAELVLRRHLRHWHVLEPYLPLLLQNDDGYREILNRFARFENGKTWLIRSLTREIDSTAWAYRLILDWHRAGEGGLRPSINRVTDRLVTSDQAAKAYRLFRVTLDSQEAAEAGYVFNPAFNLPPTGNLFDWRLAEQAGMSIAIKGIPPLMGTPSESKKNVLDIRFLNTPVRFSKILQYLKLPPSDFNLEIVFSTRDLVAKKPVKLALECTKGSQILKVVEFPTGSSEISSQKVSLKVPEQGCELQQIRVYNDNIVESWRNRYSGSLYFHNISLSLVGA